MIRTKTEYMEHILKILGNLRQVCRCCGFLVDGTSTTGIAFAAGLTSFTSVYMKVKSFEYFIHIYFEVS